MKYYTVKIELVGIEAETWTEALKKFWDRVDDTDYPIQPQVEEE